MDEHIIQHQQQPLLTPSTFLSYIKANYFLNLSSIPENTKQTIQSTVPHLLSQNIPLPYELLFYIYLLTISNDPSYTSALTALSKMRHIENLSQIISTSLTTSNYVSLLPLTKDNVLPLFTSTALEHPNETNIYLGLVKLIEFISAQTQTQQSVITMIPHVLQQFKHESLLELQIVLIILNYFDNIEQLNDVEMYMLIFEMLIGKFDMKIHRAKDIPLLKWILTKINTYNISIANNNNTVNALLKQFCIEFRNVLADNDTQFLTNVLPKILVLLVHENKMHLLSKYQTLREGIIDVYYYSKLPTQLKFSVFYYKLLCKIKKREYANYITLNSNKVNNYVDVYLMFIYMNKHSRGILNNTNPFNEIISKIELNEHVDVFQYRNNIYNPNKINFFSTDYHMLNKYVERNVIHYEKVKFSINNTNDNNNTLIDYFNALALKAPSQIVFIETYNDDNNYDTINNDSVLKHASITYTPAKEHKVKYYFQFKGLFVVDSNKTKYVFLYEKHSRKWYSPYHKRWEFYIQNLLPDDITTFTFVYYRRQSKLPYIDIYNNHSNINALPKGNETDFYWKMFTHIATINPLLLKQSIYVYYKMFSLHDIANIKLLYAFLESECDLKHNEHSKHLLLDVVMTKRLSRSNEDDESVIKEIEMKWFVMNSNTLLDKIKNYLNRNASDVYSNNTYEISLLLWNVYYTYQHISDNVNQRVIPKLLPCYLCLMYMWYRLINDEDKCFWETALKGISIAPKFTLENANSLHKAFPFDNIDTICINNIKKYWNEVTLKLIDEYKLKCLSEFMLFYIENANNVNDDTTLCNNFELFITNNKLLLSVTNINNDDTKCIIHLIYNYITLFKKDNTMHIYNNLVSKCFTGEDNTIQLTELQKLVVDDYVKELLCKETKGYPVEKLEYIMRFVLDEERLQEIFITELLRRKENEDAFHKVVKPILLMINQYIDNEKYVNIRYVVVYYMMYCKINKMKKKIENINCNNNNIHYVFMKMNKVNNVDDVVFKENVLMEGNNDVIMNVNAIENEIKDIETKLNKKIFLFNHIQQPNNNINIDNDIPLIVYNYQPLLNNNALSNKDKMFYIVHDNKRIDYKLKGIVLKPINVNVNDEVKEVVLINNEHNAYWYSLYEKKWMNAVDSYLNNEMYSHIMKVYCLVDKSKKHSNLTFGDLPDEGSNSPYFENNIKTEMKWLLNNAVVDMNNHIKPFYNMFNLQYERFYNDIINIEGVDYDDNKVKEVLNRITRITQYKNLQKIRQLAD